MVTMSISRGGSTGFFGGSMGMAAKLNLGAIAAE